MAVTHKNEIRRALLNLEAMGTEPDSVFQNALRVIEQMTDAVWAAIYRRIHDGDKLDCLARRNMGSNSSKAQAYTPPARGTKWHKSDA